jgi:hypothetical protein
MAAIPLIYGEPSWLRIVPGVLASGEKTIIASLGSKSDFTAAVKVAPTVPNLTSTSEKWHTSDIANGNKLSIPDVSKNYNILSGAEIADEGGDNSSKFECEVTCTPAQRALLYSWAENGTPIIASREIGKNSSTQAVAGYEYIIGQIADLKENPDKSAHKYSFSVVGKSTFTIKQTSPPTPDFDEDDYNTIATGSGNTITPLGESARTILALTSDDWARLFTGKIVSKLVS